MTVWSAVPRVLVGAIAAAALLGGLGVVSPDAAAAPAGTVPEETPSDVLTTAEVRTREAIAALEARASAGRVAWTTADGQLLAAGQRDALATSLAEAATLLGDPRRILDAVDEAAAERYLDELRAAGGRIGQEMTRLGDEIVNWHAAQTRLAAQRAAERAAQKTSRPAPRSSPAGSVTASAPRARTERIWTTGGQAQIDRCRGAVDVTGLAAYLGGDFYAAEHWRCGGSAWSGIRSGAVVTFPGYGTYRVVGRVGGLAYGADATAIPSGYAGYYQTCIGGSSSNMTVWLLARA